MIRVLIAEDHEVFRIGLKAIIEEAPGILVVGEAPDGQAALQLVSEIEVDVVTLDTTMPGKPALSVLSKLRKATPPPRVLILTAHPEDDLAIRFLQEGADGYVNKMSSSEELIRAIRVVYDGHKYVGPRLAEELALKIGRLGDGLLHERLSNREFQILCLIGNGKAVSEIAEELALSPKTVSTYRSRILHKTGLKNNAKILRYAVRAGLVDL